MNLELIPHPVVLDDEAIVDELPNKLPPTDARNFLENDKTKFCFILKIVTVNLTTKVTESTTLLIVWVLLNLEKNQLTTIIDG